jgi:hypothetical protein
MVTNAVQETAGQYQVDLLPASARQFYRLIRP